MLSAFARTVSKPEKVFLPTRKIVFVVEKIVVVIEKIVFVSVTIFSIKTMVSGGRNTDSHGFRSPADPYVIYLFATISVRR